ncbi:MAG: GntP family permease [Nocardioidaceae bacterium]
MNDSLLLVNTAFGIVAMVAAITWLRLNPVFALLLGTLYLGLTSGIGVAKTTESISAGFGEVMVEIGLLVTFGVILGSLLTSTHALQRLVELLLNRFGDRSLPYIFSVSLSSLFSSIYSDVLLVLSAPIARRIGPRLGPHGIALMGGALTAGIEVGLVFVVPGVAAIAAAGLLGVPLGQMFVFGLLIGLPTAVLTMLAFAVLLPRVVRWNPELDEEPDDAIDPDGTAPTAPGSAEGAAGPGAVGAAQETQVRQDPLVLALSPVFMTLILIAGGAIADAAGWHIAVLDFFSDPVVAMLLGALFAYVLALRVRTRAEVGDALNNGLITCGPILVLSGISGSLGAVLSESGLADILAGYFSSNLMTPLLLVWLVAAILHIALGSISTAVITAAGILAPIVDRLDTPAVLIALAAGSGAMFVPHVSSNFFWMFQRLLGLSTRGTFKTHSVAMTLSSVISLPLVLLLSVFV